MTDLDAVWRSLRPPDSGLSARLYPNHSDVWLALDPQGRRHLVARVSRAAVGLMLMETRGLRAVTERLSIGGRVPDTWVDIACLDPGMNATFLAVADDLAGEVAQSPTAPLEAVRRTLRSWQWFWGVDPTSMTREAELGLFAELWFLDRWAPFPDAVDCWTGPIHDRHDFVASEVSVEVKATQVRTDGPARHRISTLDQLAEPATGILYLFSLRLVADLNASNTLGSLIERIRSRLRSQPPVATVFDRGLAKSGWSPRPVPESSYRVLAEELYRVEDDFPRLVSASFSSGVPSGVESISYSLDLAACEPWRVATLPQEGRPFLAELRR